MQIQTNQKQRELKDHGTFAFPVNVSHENLFSYERSSFFWHWHPEIELTLIVSGDINYQVNDKTYHLMCKHINSVPFYFFSLFHSSDYSLNNWLASFQHCRPAARMEHG